MTMSRYHYELRKVREMERREPYYALLDAIIAGGYTLEGARRAILERLERIRERVESLGKGDIYIESPVMSLPTEYVREKLRRKEKMYQNLLRSLEYYAELCIENPGLIDLMIEQHFTGRKREAREVFRRFCGNITGGLLRYMR